MSPLNELLLHIDPAANNRNHAFLPMHSFAPWAHRTSHVAAFVIYQKSPYKWAGGFISCDFHHHVQDADHFYQFDRS